MTSEANQTAGVPARATVGDSKRQNCSQTSAPAHRNFRSARWSHPTNKILTTSSFEVGGTQDLPCRAAPRSSHLGEWFGGVSKSVEIHTHVSHHAEIETRHLAIGLAEVVQILTAFDLTAASADNHNG
ncbi:MAG: hypothetical protein ACI8P0_002121 [Planctomycetaceae bacterium]